MTKPHFIAISFGYGHGAPPAARLTVDVRDWFKDPHVSPELRALTGRDSEVIEKVLATPYVTGYLIAQMRVIEYLLNYGVDVTFAVGCVGGRHRSVVIADALAEWLAGAGRHARAQQRDLDKDVIQR